MARSVLTTCVLCCIPLSIVTPGCSKRSYELASVSGVVTLDGEPLPDARVMFNPVDSANDLSIGPPSIDVTDEEGQFEMTTTDGSLGAVVGSHHVRITTYRESVDPKNVHRIIVKAEERAPTRYQKPGELTCEVPPEGLANVEFNLTSKP